MTRIQFPKGKQREFLQKVVTALSSPSLRSLGQFGIKVNYSTLKNYYNEDRTLPEEFFIQCCTLAKLSSQSFPHTKISEHWGKSKGGKTKRRYV